MTIAQKIGTSIALHIYAFAPKVCFFQIPSSILNHSFEEISAFCDRGHMFWGNFEKTQKNYTQVKEQIQKYNKWLEKFCAQHDQTLLIPLNDLLHYNADTIEEVFSDINHFTDDDAGRKMLATNISAYLVDKSEFFVKKICDNSEYIYPVF